MLVVFLNQPLSAAVILIQYRLLLLGSELMETLLKTPSYRLELTFTSRAARLALMPGTSGTLTVCDNDFRCI
jgi:hypothetical protein